MKTNLFIVAILFITQLGQLNAQNVSYKVLEDDPDTKNIFIAANVFDINAYMANMSLGYNIYANAFLGKRFQADVDYRKAYNDAGIGIFSPKDLTKNFQIRLGGQFNLVNKLARKNARVVLSSFSSGGFTHTTFISVPANFRRIFAVRGGLQYFYNNCRTDNGANNSRAANDDDMRAKINGQVVVLTDPNNFETVNYTVNTFGIYGGLSYKSICNIIIDAESWGKKGRSVLSDFYADVLFCPLVSYDIKPNSNQAYLKDADLNISENKPSYLGWRFGWQAALGRKVAFTTKMEIGQQPGNRSETFFVNLGIGIGFGTKWSLLDKF
ncbi:MAG: hypothetical protein V4538_10225 [Bacteroidota bacterium]